jgi:methylglyoxal synthase
LALLRLADVHNIPVATNLAAAEIMIRAVKEGELSWRELVNPTR